MESTVRTVLGDIGPGELGVTYLHEHLIIDHPLIVDRFPHISLPSVEDAVAELGHCTTAGVETMVDAMPCASGRNITKLAEVSLHSGVNVVAATGLHAAKYYVGVPWAMEASPQALAALFIADITEGIDRFDYTGPIVERTDHHAGIVKMATTGERPIPAEERLIEAVAITHRATGCPILTHCEEGRGGAAQVERLVSHGVDPGRVTLSHTDKVTDPSYHRELLDTGVNLEYDQILRQSPDTERGTIWLLGEMISEGRLPQLMLGTDGARRSLWTELGGSPGLAHLHRTVDRIFDEETSRALFIDNPARFLAIEADI